MTVRVGEGTFDARWDEDRGLVTPQEVYEAVLELEARGKTVGYEPTGPWWVAGDEDPDQAYWTVQAAVEEVGGEVLADVAGPPGWPYGVPEGATDR